MNSQGERREFEMRPSSLRKLSESGFDLDSYSITDLPTGWRRVVLVVSTWHKTKPAVVCFFLDFGTGGRYRASVFRNPKTYRYGPGELDFSSIAPGTEVEILIHQNSTGTF